MANLIRRKQYRKVLCGVVTIQKNYRAFLMRKRFLLLRKAAIVFQKQLRGQLARRVYRQLLAEKQEREERKRQEEEKKREEEERYVLAWVRHKGTLGMSPLLACQEFPGNLENSCETIDLDSPEDSGL